MKYSELALHPAVRKGIEANSFVECTDIQERAIPHILDGKDIAGLAQTGTGKTAAFLIPLLDRLLWSQEAEVPEEFKERPFKDWRKNHFILVLVPTRELAEQVLSNFKTLGSQSQLKAVSVYGGTSYEPQKAAFKEGVDVVIATPGRLIDLLKDHVVDLGQVRAVVFDEADRMFDMGFKDDMKYILQRIPKDRQFLVFSATLNFEVLEVAYEYGAHPIEINVSRDQAKAENVEDKILHLAQEEKPQFLLSLLRKYQPKQAIIFSNFRHNVERISKFLSDNGQPAMGISSLLTQAQRTRVMEQFRAENDQNILIATDLAARGLDVKGVDMVINFDLPDDAENYVHRIGRTGRASAEGKAFSLVSDKDVEALQRVESFLEHKVDVVWLEDVEVVKDFAPFPQDRQRSFRPSGGRGEQRSGRGGRDGGRDRGPRGGRDGGRDRGPDQRGVRNRYDGSNRGDKRERYNGSDSGPSADLQDLNSAGAEFTRTDTRPPRGEHKYRDGGAGEGRNRNRNRRRRKGGPRPDQQNAGGGQPRAESGNGQAPKRRGYRDRKSGGGHKYRPHAAAAAAKKGDGVGSKVSGFFKKLFGGQ